MSEIVTCKCGNKFTTTRYNGILRTKQCPNCRLQSKLKKQKPNTEYKPWGQVEKKKPLFDTSNPNNKKANDAIKAIKKKKTPMQLARDRADSYFSKYIRTKHGYGEACKCYTHDKPKFFPFKKTDNGHYISRGRLSVRYDERNARPQCQSCNRFKSGQHDIFRVRLIDEIGLEEVEDLERLAQQQQDETIEFYNAMSDKYRLLLKELQKQ